MLPAAKEMKRSSGDSSLEHFRDLEAEIKARHIKDQVRVASLYYLGEAMHSNLSFLESNFSCVYELFLSL